MKRHDPKQAPVTSRAARGQPNIPRSRRTALLGAAAGLLFFSLGCQATALDHWRTMSTSRVQPLTAHQIASLDDWHTDKPVTTIVRVGEVR